MNGRFIVVPSRSAIMLRSVSYGAAWGAAAGALVAIVPTIVGVLFDPLVLIAVVIASAVGAIVGVACGLTGGLGLVIFRRRAGTSRCAVQAVAAAGAGLAPTAPMLWVLVSSGPRGLPLLGVLTLVVVALAGAVGPSAFYGKPPRKRPARYPGIANRDS